MPARTTALDFEAIFREHAPFVWRALRRLGVAEADVDDVCQEVFVVVHRRLADFEGRSALRTWIYGICVRTASDHRKRAHRRHEVATAEPAEGRADAGTPHEALAQKRELERLDRALDTLDDDKRAVFVLYEIEGLTMPEIAEALSCPLQTAYSRLHAARERVIASLRRGTLEARS
jgi:RNA polymerase sigma-70 factor (ECF subfamily)